MQPAALESIESLPVANFLKLMDMVYGYESSSYPFDV